MAAPAPGPYSLRFAVAGVPVVIEPSFWLGTLLLGASMRGQALVLWMGVVLVSLLVHEFGHAFALKAFGAGASVQLHAFGGLTFPERVVPRWKRVCVSLAGPFAGFAFGALVLAVGRRVPEPSWAVAFTLRQLLWVNFGWGLVNLAPVLPLDGGHVMQEVLGPRRTVWAPKVSAVAAVLLAVLAAWQRASYPALLFGYFALRSFQLWSQASKRAPTEALAVTASWVQEGWAALRQGWDVEAARLGTRALDAARSDEARAQALDLLAWTALAQGVVSHALSYLRRVPEKHVRALSWGLALELAGQHTEALPYAEQAVQQERSAAAASLRLRLLLHAGRTEEAEALVRAHAWADATSRLRAEGAVAVARGEYASAAALFQDAFRTSADADDGLLAARALLRAGHPERAASWLVEARLPEEALAPVPQGHPELVPLRSPFG